MKNNGFLWTIELLIGMIAISGLIIATAHSTEKKQDTINQMLCHDLMNVWTYGKNIDQIANELLPEKTYSFSKTPFNEASTNGIVCHATRITNGTMEEMFLRIES